MTDLVYFTVVCHLSPVVADVSSDSDYNPNIGSIQADVTITPKINTGDVLKSHTTSPATGFIPVAVQAIIDSDGVLKLRPTPDSGGTGSYAPVRLLGNSPALELDSPLWYDFTFANLKIDGQPSLLSIAGGSFEAPNFDTTVDLIDHLRVTGQPASGLIRLAPSAVRIVGDYQAQFSFDGVDIAEPLDLPHGQGATVSIGTVTTGAAGSTATVANSGTSGDAVLDFSVPKGDTGTAATVAVGTVTTGAVGSTATVANSGTSGAARLDFSIPRGATGSAATVAVGTVTTGAAGSTATVGNTGTSGAAVFNFTIPKGDTGTAATIAVGTTTTGAVGSTATVANSGTSGAAVFNFTIPRGNTGAAATIAVGTVTTGAVGSTATVANSGNSGAAVFDFSIPRGNTGAAATIAVGTVTTGAVGSTATVSNSGTSGAATLDFSIPRGNTGPTGPTGATGPVGVTIKGSVLDYASLPGSASDNDAYVVAADGLLYVRTGGAWPTNGTGVPWRGPSATSYQRFSQAVGDGAATSFTLTHALNTRAVAVSVYDTSTWENVEADVSLPSVNTVTVSFKTAPTASQYTVTVVAGGSSVAVDVQVFKPLAPNYITNKQLTSNVATVTTLTAHGYQVGDKVWVSGVDATFNHSYSTSVTITAVTTNTFSYAKTNADVASTAVLPYGNVFKTQSWTKPTGATLVKITMLGAGGGGGSGARQATTSHRTGGGGGGGGGFHESTHPAANLPASLVVITPNGGYGGLSITNDSTVGMTGQNGGGSEATVVRSLESPGGSDFSLTCTHGAGGGGGVAGTTIAGGLGGTNCQFVGGNGGAGNNTTGSIAANATYVGSGGGGGGGAAANSTTAAAGGLCATIFAVRSLSPSGSSGFSPGDGVTTMDGTSTPNVYFNVKDGLPGLGGPAGAYKTATAGGKGADALNYCGGGGGGGASDNGYASGAGGKGADGCVVITTYF